MENIVVDQDKLTLEIRKFLKKVGITSQREIERAVREKLENGGLQGVDSLASQMTLSIPALGVHCRIDGDIDLH